MTNWRARTIGLAAVAVTALSLTAGHALAERGTGAAPILQQSEGLRDFLPHTPGSVLEALPDTVVVLQCREVGNGDVATVVRLTSAPSAPIVPAGNGVTIYGSQGQAVTVHTLASQLLPGGHVDVQVVPWQAVYQGCSAQTSV